MGAEVFCWPGVSSLLLSWCLLTIPIYHSFNTSVKLANCILEQSSDVPISLESIKLSSLMHSPHPPLFFFFFNCPLMNFHLHHETMKSFGQLREMTGALSVSLSPACHLCGSSGLEWIYISNITSLCPFLDGGSTLLAGTMSLWLNKMACGQPG